MLLLFCHINVGLESGLFSVAILHTKNAMYLSALMRATFPDSLIHHLNI